MNRIPLTDQQKDELFELTGRLISDSLTDSQKDRLNEIVASSENACNTYCSYINMHITLSQCCDTELSKNTIEIPFDPEEILLEEVGQSPTFLGLKMKQLGHFMTRQTPLSITIALVFMISIITVLSLLPIYIGSSDNPNTADNGVQDPFSEVVATVTDIEGCRWAKGEFPRGIGDEFLQGETINITQGTLLLKFNSGAIVKLFGPAKFQLNAKNTGRLSSGILSANVSKKAIGFTVNTPHTTVVDLGTQFSVSVDKKQGSFTYVMQGKVELDYTDSTSTKRFKKELIAGQAFRVLANGTASTDTASVEKFKESIKLLTSSDSSDRYSQAIKSDRPLAYWRLNEKTGTVAKDSSGNNHHAKYEGDVKLGSSGPLRNSRTTSALFDGETAYVALPVLGKASHLTMEAWVQVDSLAKGSAILLATNKNTGSPDGSLHWQFNTNSQMVLEAKKSGWRTTVFSKSLSLKKWHHVVLTYDSSLKQVQLFVDGKLTEKIDKLSIVPANLGKSLIGGGYHRGLYLSGKIAEVALYRKVLTAKQIAKHYRASL